MGPWVKSHSKDVKEQQILDERKINEVRHQMPWQFGKKAKMCFPCAGCSAHVL